MNNPVKLALFSFIGFVLMTLASRGQELQVTTIIGNLSEDGPGAKASFVYATGIHVDKFGDVYVADAYTVKKISPQGYVTVIAGTMGVWGSADGVSTNATFRQPRAVAVDSRRRIFIADEFNRTIRLVSQDGIVSTFAGTAEKKGLVDGIGPDARFLGPRGLWIDGNDNIYVADPDDGAGRGYIRKISPEGSVTTLKDSTRRPIRLYAPEGMAMDPAGNLLVTDWLGRKVVSIGTNGMVTEIVKQTTNTTGVTLDNQGNVYYSETGLGLVRKMTPDGFSQILAGGQNGIRDGIGPEVGFFKPTGLAMTPDGSIVVADEAAIRKVSLEGAVSTFAGGAGYKDGPADEARLLRPEGLAFDSVGNLYIADHYNNLIRKMTPEGVVSTFAGKPGTFDSVDGPLSSAHISRPRGLLIALDGTIYFTEIWNGNLRKITPDGNVSLVAEGLNYPLGLLEGLDGTIYVTTHSQIYKLAPGGSLVPFVGGKETGFADGIGSNAKFQSPEGMVIDQEGCLLVADRFNHVIRRVTPDGQVTTVAGKPRIGEPIDGPLNIAQFSGPRSMLFDEDGNLYVAESHAIRMITTNGVVKTIAGNSKQGGLADGVGSQVRLGGQLQIAKSPTGEIFISDFDHSNLRKAVWDSPRPKLQAIIINGALHVRWPSNATTFLLESSLSLDSGWEEFTAPMQIDGEWKMIVVSIQSPAVYFRLRKI